MGKKELDRVQEITREQMEETIIQSGYVLEHRVEQVFSGRGYHISNNNYYIDSDTNKMREIDLIAENASTLLHQPAQEFNGIFTFRLICECENNHQPTVFFVSEGKSPDHGQGLIHSSVPNPSLPPNATPKDHLMWGDSLFNAPNVYSTHHFSQMQIATQYCTFFPKDKTRPDNGWIARHSDDQHNTFQGLLKAAMFTSEKDAKRIEQWPFAYYGRYQIYLYYPVVILQNQLLAARVTKDGLNLQDCDHVMYWRNHKSEDSEHLFGVDVIRESYLPQYLTLVEKEVEAIHLEILKNPYLKESIDNWTQGMIGRDLKDL